MTGSVDLRTEFDTCVEPLATPARIDRSGEAAMLLVDGAAQVDPGLVRLQSDRALLGLKVCRPREGLRVTLTLGADARSGQRWQRLTGSDAESLAGQRPRLLLVRSQGKLRSAALLTPTANRPGADVHARVQFDLETAAVDPRGLVIIELASPLVASGPLVGLDLLEHPSLGVRVDSIDLAEAEAAGTASVSGGHLNTSGPFHRARGNLFVLNHDPLHSTHEWLVQAVAPKADQADAGGRVRPASGSHVARLDGVELHALGAGAPPSHEIDRVGDDSLVIRVTGRGHGPVVVRARTSGTDHRFVRVRLGAGAETT